MPLRKSQFQVWYEQVKRELLITEPQNILARSECCQNIINECLNHLNSNLGLSQLSGSDQYICGAKPKEHLKFLVDWPGLRVDNSPKAPKSKKEYEKKSKNWLNGRRAPNYGRTLFPFFIRDAEKYIACIAKKLIPNDDKKEKLYYDMVIYKVLAQLCGCSVSLHEQAKKAPFFCKNSIERKGRLKEILQKYAVGHEYIQGFPSCFEEAIGFFDAKSNGFFHQFRREYMGYTNNKFDDDDDDENKRRVTKREPEQIINTREVEYWKNQTLKLQQQIETEKRMRIQAEAERDTFRRILEAQQNNSNNRNQCNCESPECNNQHLGLANDPSLTSSNGSTASTSSLTYNIPSLQPSASYHSAASSSANLSRHSHHMSHCSHDIPTSFQSRQQQQLQQRQMQMNHLLPPILGYVPNDTSMEINHSKHHLNQNYFVNNCRSNSNVFIHANRNNNVLSQRFPTNGPQSTLPAINSNQTSTSIMPQNSNPNQSSLFIDATNNNNFEHTAITTMPAMNTLQQISDDSFNGFDTFHSNNNGLGIINSPAPVYSFQNAVVSNNTTNDHFI